MSKKAYSEQERKQVGQDLLSVGLEMLSQRGLKGTKLQDILQAVGLSKPFFYGNYYASLAELVLHIIDYEISLLLETVRDDIAKRDASVEDRINHFLKMMIDSRQHHFFVMTQEEEVLVSKHLTPEELEAFQKGQAAFYGELLSLWHIPEEKCTPKELGNLILSVVLIYNSAARSLPFFFPEELERTARAQATALSRYLAAHRMNRCAVFFMDRLAFLKEFQYNPFKYFHLHNRN